MRFPDRIDVHHHIVPPMWSNALYLHGREFLGKRFDGLPSLGWGVDSALSMMDEQGVAASILSVTSPGVHLGDREQARGLARSANEYTAQAVEAHPERFGFFASLPLPDVEAAVAEAAYALDTLGADGVVLMSNVRGAYPGADDHEPLWAELDRRKAVVFLHPAQPPLPLLHDTAGPLVDYVYDTTRAAVDLVLGGVLRRHPDVKIILAHGGGFLPYAAHRFAGLAPAVGETTRDADELIEDFARFYFDTALSAGPAALPSLLAFARPGHLLFGSDWPVAPAEVGASQREFLEAYPCDDAVMKAVNRGNAAELFPRFA
ncbi:amidohydrolase family protein [Streptomyces sp. NPDC085995]|uniref:amidohydrolase family protein n=1 Tax=Streptomyces sp. NPDC085995 TaxID=3154861 RepID=UPI003413532F